MKSTEIQLNQGWLADVAAALPASPGFEERCVSAALDAYEIAKLNAAREQCGFVPVTLEQYVEGLARRAEVELERVLRWAGLPNLQPSVATAPGLGRLISAIGAGVQEARMLVRMSWADQLGHGPVPMLVSYRGASRGRSEFEMYEDALRHAEATYPTADRARLEETLDLVLKTHFGGDID